MDRREGGWEGSDGLKEIDGDRSDESEEGRKGLLSRNGSLRLPFLQHCHLVLMT